MLISKGTREEAIHALINTWLKAPGMKCGACGAGFSYKECCKLPYITCETGFLKCKRCKTVFYPVEELCCEAPFITNNAGLLKQFHKETEQVRQTRKNEYASTGKIRGTKNTMRWKLSFPPTLLWFLEKSFDRLYH